MEAAPLTQAHAFARDASRKARSSVKLSSIQSTTVEHQHRAAAAKFAQAATRNGASRQAQDPEALRVLKLLEHHHQKLADLAGSVKKTVRSDNDGAKKDTGNEPQDVGIEEDVAIRRKPESQRPLSPIQQSETEICHDEETLPKQDFPSLNPRRSPPSSSTPRMPRRLGRESSSSIAGNLATARGIPTSQQRTARNALKQSQQASTQPRESEKELLGKQGAQQVETKTSDEVSYMLEKPTNDNETNDRYSAQVKRLEQENTQQGAYSSSEDAFKKFYSTFGGLFSKLSAPLAFAGLPLNPEEQAPSQDPITQATSVKPSGERATESDLPADMNKIYSKAALRAIKDDHGPLAGMQESFYVVPTGGGTVPYASILSRRGQRDDAHHDSRDISSASRLYLQQTDEDSSLDHFVDARESPSQNMPPKFGKQVSNARSPSTNKTFEELELENASFRRLTDDLSRRLYMWEKSAQSQTSALQQSMRMMRGPTSPPLQQLNQPSTEGAVDGEGGGVSEGVAKTEVTKKTTEEQDRKVRELEEQVRAAKQDVERFGRENEKLKTVVMRYRERWEKLKEGARTRRESYSGRDTPTKQAQLG